MDSTLRVMIQMPTPEESCVTHFGYSIRPKIPVQGESCPVWKCTRSLACRERCVKYTTCRERTGRGSGGGGGLARRCVIWGSIWYSGALEASCQRSCKCPNDGCLFDHSSRCHAATPCSWHIPCPRPLQGPQCQNGIGSFHPQPHMRAPGPSNWGPALPISLRAKRPQQLWP